MCNFDFKIVTLSYQYRSNIIVLSMLSNFILHVLVKMFSSGCKNMCASTLDEQCGTDPRTSSIYGICNTGLVCVGEEMNDSGYEYTPGKCQLHSKYSLKYYIL